MTADSAASVSVCVATTFPGGYTAEVCVRNGSSARLVDWEVRLHADFVVWCLDARAGTVGAYKTFGPLQGRASGRGVEPGGTLRFRFEGRGSRPTDPRLRRLAWEAAAAPRDLLSVPGIHA